MYMYMYYYAQTLRFSSVVCGAFTSSLQARVTFCRWLIKENRVFWLEPVALGSRVGAQTTRYFNWSQVGPQNRYFAGAGSESRLWESVPEPMLTGTRFFKRVELRFRFSIWNRVEPAEPPKPIVYRPTPNTLCLHVSMFIMHALKFTSQKTCNVQLRCETAIHWFPFQDPIKRCFFSKDGHQWNYSKTLTPQKLWICNIMNTIEQPMRKIIKYMYCSKVLCKSRSNHDVRKWARRLLGSRIMCITSCTMQLKALTEACVRPIIHNYVCMYVHVM